MPENRVRITLTADGQDANAAFDQLNRRMDETQREAGQTQRSMRDLDQGVGAVADKFKDLGLVVGTAATGLAYLGKQSLNQVAQLQKEAEMAGIAVESYQELSHVAAEYRISQEALTDAIKELNLRADEWIETAKGPAEEAFRRLGYSQEELNRKLADAPALLQDIVERMEGLDKAAQIRIADEIFGGQGGEQFVALINGGAEAIGNLTREARALGLVMDEDLVKQAAEANEELDVLWRVIKTQFSVALAEVAPDIAALASDLATIVSKTHDAIEAFKAFYNTFNTFGEYQDMVSGYMAKLKDLRAEEEQLMNKLANLPEETNAQIRTIRERVEDDLHHVRLEMDRTEELLAKYTEQRDENTGSTDDNSEAHDNNTDALDKNKAKVDELAASIVRLNEARIAGRDWDRDNPAPYGVGSWYGSRRGGADDEWALGQMEREVEQANERIREQDEATRHWMEDEWVTFSENLSRTLVDDFRVGADDIKELFENLWQNIAAYYAKNAIILPVMAQMNLPGLSQGAMAQMAGGDGGFGMPNIPGLSSVGNFLGGTIPGSAGAYGAGGISWGGALGAGALAGAGYGMFGDSLGLPTSQYSSLTAGLGGAAGAYGGASLAGMLGAGAVEAGTGMVAGSMMGSVLPVVGTILGGVLGGALGGVFGGSDKDPRIYYGFGVPKNPPGNSKYGQRGALMGPGGLSVNFKEEDSDIPEDELNQVVVEWFTEYFNQIEAATGQEIAAIIGDEQFRRRIKDVSGFLEDGEAGLQRLISKMVEDFNKTYGDNVQAALEANLEGQIPIDLQEGSVEQMIAQFSSARKLIDQIDEYIRRSGMTEEERAIEDINAKWDQMRTQLEALGVSVDETNIAQARAIELEETRAQYIEDTNETMQQLARAEDRLAQSRTRALEQLDSMTNRLMSSSNAPVQSIEYFENRYDTLLSNIQSAGPGDVQQAVSAFTSFAPQFLEFAGSYGGNYKNIFDSVMADIDAARNAVSSSPTQYRDGPADAIFSAYNDFFGRDPAQAGLDYWTSRIRNDPEVTTGNVDDYILGGAQGGDLRRAQDRGYEVSVRVFVGDRELKDITAEVIRTDPETQDQIRRVTQ